MASGFESIESFIQKVKQANRNRSKEIRFQIEELHDFSLTLTQLLSFNNELLMENRQLRLGQQTPSTINVNVAGGSFK